MTSLTFSSSSGGLFPNATTSTVRASCSPCSGLRLAPGIGVWGSVNPAIPAIRTIQVVVDPNQNSTSTSIECNRAALSAYKTHSQDPEMYSLDDDCNLVARYLVAGFREDMQLATVTMTQPSGRNIELGSAVWASGEIATTDSKGDPTCVLSWSTKFATPIGTYTGPIETVKYTLTASRASTVIVDGTTTTIASTFVSVDPIARVWLMPDLTNLVPGIAAIEQCTTIFPDGSPVALTRANEIILPARTLPLLSKSTSPSSLASKSSSMARPGNSQVVALPISTTTESRTTTSIPTSTGEEIPGSPDSGTQRPEPADGKQSESPTEKPSASPSRDSAGSTPNIVIVPINPPSLPNNSPGGAAADSKIASIKGVGSISAIANNPDAYALGTKTTLSAGGPAATIDGTVYSASSSGSRVLAVPNKPGAELAPYIAAGISGQGLDGGEAAYVLAEGTTLVASREGITIGGTTYSALPSGAGVLEVANGQSKIITTFAPLVSGNEGPEEAYILESSATISAGGAAVTIAGTTYSALPSAAGVLQIANGQSTTVTTFPPAVSDIAPQAVNTYVLGGSATISAGGTAAAIAGTTYSALSSGAGVLVAADGKSSTTSTSDGLARPNSTGEAYEGNTMAPYTGSASSLNSSERLTASVLACAAAAAAAFAVLVLARGGLEAQ